MPIANSGSTIRRKTRGWCVVTLGWNPSGGKYNKCPFCLTRIRQLRPLSEVVFRFVRKGLPPSHCRKQRAIIEGNAEDNLEVSVLYLPAPNTARQANYSLRYRQTYDVGDLPFQVQLQPVQLRPFPNVPARLSFRWANLFPRAILLQALQPSRRTGAQPGTADMFGNFTQGLPDLNGQPDGIFSDVPGRIQALVTRVAIWRRFGDGFSPHSRTNPEGS